MVVQGADPGIFKVGSSIKSGSVGSIVWSQLSGKLIRSGHVLYSVDCWHCTETSGCLSWKSVFQSRTMGKSEWEEA